jgi:hypothetical protein
LTIVAPQKCDPRFVKLAINGVCPCAASLPPTTLLSLVSFRHGNDGAAEKKQTQTPNEIIYVIACILCKIL